jgi:O-antigen/teichoic acid export membrane protein
MEDNKKQLPEEAHDFRGGKGLRKIFTNFGMLTFGKIGGDIFTFILFVVLSRKFGQEGVGQYSFAVGLTGFLAVCSDFGLYSYTVKEISKNKESYGRYFQKIFSLRMVQSAIVVLVLIGTVPFFNFSPQTKIIIFLLGCYQIIYSLIDGISAVFIAFEYMHISATIDASLKILTSFCAIMIALLGGSIIASLSVLPIIALLQFIAVRYFLKKKIGESLISFSLPVLKETFLHAFPYGISDLSAQLFGRIDVVLLGFLLSESSAGIYNVGYRVVFFLYFIPKYSSITLFPIASRLYHESKDGFRQMYNRSLNMMIILGLPLSAGLYLIAPDLIGLVFGSTFAESALVLKILSGLFLLHSLSNLIEIFLMTSDHQKARAKCQWIATMFCVVLNFLFILYFKIEGAAVAVLLSYFVLVIMFAVILKPVTGFPDVKSRLAISFTGILIFFTVFSIIKASMFVVIPGSIVLYVATLVSFKSIRENELRMAMHLVRK